MTDMMEMLNSARHELNMAYALMFDEQIYRLFGTSPNPVEVARRGRIVKRRDIEGFYDEFQLDGIPKFQQRVRFKDCKIFIELKNVSPQFTAEKSR